MYETLCVYVSKELCEAQKVIASYIICEAQKQTANHQLLGDHTKGVRYVGRI